MNRDVCEHFNPVDLPCEKCSVQKSTLREAAQQALEALEWSWGGEPMGTLERDAITALRAALAEPPTNQCGETCERAKLCAVCASGLAEHAEPAALPQTFVPKDRQKQSIISLTDQCAALIQERDELQKQVWLYEKNGVTCQTYRHTVEQSCAECNVQMNYTAPPQRKPLTDEQVRDLWSWAMTAEAERTATTQQHAFARAIERAHGIGGNT